MFLDGILLGTLRKYERTPMPKAGLPSNRPIQVSGTSALNCFSFRASAALCLCMGFCILLVAGHRKVSDNNDT